MCSQFFDYQKWKTPISYGLNGLIKQHFYAVPVLLIFKDLKI
jgi:hypothetical protein